MLQDNDIQCFVIIKDNHEVNLIALLYQPPQCINLYPRYTNLLKLGPFTKTNSTHLLLVNNNACKYIVEIEV